MTMNLREETDETDFLVITMLMLLVSFIETCVSLWRTGMRRRIVVQICKVFMLDPLRI